MVLIFGYDRKSNKEKRFVWKPLFFRNTWRNNKKVIIIDWGFWSLRYYPKENLDSFFKTINKENIKKYFERAY